MSNEARRFNALMCGRRFGKSTYGKIRAALKAGRGQKVGWFSPAYKYLTQEFQALASWLAPVTERLSVQERQIKLVSGGLIDFWSLEDVESGRGRDYDEVIIDEASISPNLERAWQNAIRPTLTDRRGSAWFLFTPRGRGFTYSLYLRGQSGDPEWMSWRIPTTANPYIPADEVASARSDMPEAAYLQEYEGEPADDGANPFGIDAIAMCLEDVAETDPVVWGWDLAKSVDWTVGIALDAWGRVCRMYRFQQPWQETEEAIARSLDAPALVDSTGVGDPIVERLSRRSRLVEGFKFTSTSRQQLLEGLRAAIHHSEVKFPDGPLRRELESFSFEYTRTGGVRYAAPDGLHDDCAMALALAVWKWRDLGYGMGPRGETDTFDAMFGTMDAADDVVRAELSERAAVAKEATRIREARRKQYKGLVEAGAVRRGDPVDWV